MRISELLSFLTDPEAEALKSSGYRDAELFDDFRQS